MADVLGGPWLEKTRAAIATLVEGEEGDDAAAVLLLQDFVGLFERHGLRVPSAVVVKALEEMEERPWPEWKNGRAITARQVARVLRPFGIRPKDLRTDGGIVKGYERADFEDAFGRYLPPSIRDSATTAEPRGVSDPSIRYAEEGCRGWEAGEDGVQWPLSRCRGSNPPSGAGREVVEL